MHLASPLAKNLGFHVHRRRKRSNSEVCDLAHIVHVRGEPYSEGTVSNSVDPIMRVVQVLAVFIVLPMAVTVHGGCTKEKAYIAAMKSDLRNLMSAQEQQFADNGRYAASLSELAFRASSGVTMSIGQATRAGWSATAVHGGTVVWCAIFVGDARLFAGIAEESAPACWS